MNGVSLFSLFGSIAVNGVEETSKQLKDVTKDGKKAGNELKVSFQEIGKKAGELGTKVAVGLGALVTGIVAGTGATREFRQDLGKLETQFKTTNLGAGAANETFISLYGILGEDDTAIEAANHLAMLADNEQELNQWTNILTGVYATFGDSLPIEGLAEAANETAKVGTVTGGLADALNWAGISEDDFNEKLAKCNDEAEREQLIRETLTGLYSEASTTYQDINSDLISSNEAQAELNMQMAETTSQFEPLIEKGKEFLAEVLEKLEPIITWLIENLNVLVPIVLGFLGTLFALNIAAKVQSFIPILQSLWGIMSANPLGVIITIIGFLVTAFVTLWNNVEGFRQFWINAWEMIKNVASVVWEAIKSFFKGAWDFIKGVWGGVTGFFSGLWEGIKNVFSGVVNFFKGIFTGAWDAIKNVFSGIVNFFKGIWDKIASTFSALGTKIGDAISGAVKGAINGVLSIIEGIINGFFKLINGAISAINLIPGVNIKKIEMVKFPRLFEGGVLERGQTGFLEGNGAEAVVPLHNNKKWISKVADDMDNALGGSGVIEKLDRIIDLLLAYFPALLKRKIMLSTGELVGALVDPMDKALADKSDDRRRKR